MEARSAVVQSVVSPTSFWIGTSQRDRLFIELPAPFPVTVDQKVSFVGYVDPNHEDTVDRYGLVGQDAVQLREQGYHLHAEADAIHRG